MDGLENDMPMPVVEGEVEGSETRPAIEAQFEPEDSPEVNSIVQAADRLVRSRFAGLFRLEESFLALARSKRTDGSNAVTVDGVPVETWQGVSTQALERFIQVGSAEAFFAAQVATDMYAEATLTKYDYDDDSDAAYLRTSGTIPERQAHAKIVTRDKRYQALFRAIAYKKAKEAVERLDSHVRRATVVLQARAKADAGERYSSRYGR